MKVVETVLALLLGTAIASTGASSAQALVLLQDDFNNEIPGLGKTTLTQWDVTAGTVDIYSLYPLQGLSVDMEGTPGNATIQTKLPFELRCTPLSRQFL
jgi:hypothetical protein